MSQIAFYGSGGGGGGTPVTTINGDTGSATGATITFDALTNSGGSILFNATGSDVFLNITDASFNTVIGKESGGTLAGVSNTGIGFQNLFASSSGEYNTAIGYSALSAISTGSRNIGIGQLSGPTLQTGSYNIYVGDMNSASSSESNTTRIGNSSQTSACFILGIDGVNVGSTANVVTEVGNKLGTAAISAGTGITVTPGANTITIASSGIGAFSWSVITADQTAVVNRGYICNKASTLLLALPATSAVGDTIEVTGINTATGWRITQASGQQIFYGASTTTSGATGSLTSSATRDAIKIVCIIDNTTWQAVTGSIGNITVV